MNKFRVAPPAPLPALPIVNSLTGFLESPRCLRSNNCNIAFREYPIMVSLTISLVKFEPTELDGEYMSCHINDETRMRFYYLPMSYFGHSDKYR